MKIKMNKIDVFLIFILALTITFIIAMIWIFYNFQAVPDSLVAGFFALAGGECGILGWIKRTKERKQERQWEIEDRKENIITEKKGDEENEMDG